MIKLNIRDYKNLKMLLKKREIDEEQIGLQQQEVQTLNQALKHF